MVVFLLNGLLFILIGLQLRTIVAHLSPSRVGAFLVVTALVSLAVIVVRLVWMFPGARLARLLVPAAHRQPSAPWQSVVVAGWAGMISMPGLRASRSGWQSVVVAGWAGMGGVVSLAAALALPRTVEEHGHVAALPGRDLIIVVSFGVILVTLVGKGLSLPWLIRRLGLSPDDGEAREEAKARYKAAQAALARLDLLASEDWAPANKVEHLRAQYQHRSHVLSAALNGHDDEDHDHVAETAGYRRLRREMLTAERQMVVALRDRGAINDEVLHRIQRELDLEEVQLASADGDA